MPMDLPAAYSRLNRANGGAEGHLVRMPSDSASGTLKDRRSTSGTSQLRSFWPMLLVLALAAVVLLTTGSQLHHSTTAQPEHLTQTIQQLSQNQAAMMQMLQRLSANGSAAAAAAAAPAAEQEQQAGAGAAAAGDEEALPVAFAAIPKLTTLHNELLRSSHTYEQHRTVMRDTLQRLVHLEPLAALAEIKKQLKDQANSKQHMALFTYRLYKLLLSTEKLIPCREDTTLVVSDPELAAGPGHSSSTSHHHAHLPHLPHWGHHSSSAAGSSSSAAGAGTAAAAAAGAGAPTTRYYFATNLRDNSVNMPQYILSLLQTLLRLPQGAVFVSAYESNSDDGAHGWVDVLQLALNVIGTPSRLVTRGMLVRLEGSNRIQHLARVRNMALAPLYQHYAAARDSAVANSSSSSSAGSSGSGSIGRRRRRLATTAQLEAVASVDDAANLPPGVLPWDPDYVVFVNDAYFCWGQVIRLLNYKADITCGMDFWQNADATVELPADLARKHHKPKPHIPSEYRLERPIRKPESPDQDNPIVFYDVWVARDLSGSKFWWTYPYVHDQGTQHAAQKGLPFRASCCWNGMAVLKAAPFKAGVRIRPPMKDECQGSECTMLCNDFARLGYDYVVVDAGVQLTYDWNLAREMMALGIEGYGQSTWAQAKAAGIAERNRKPDYKNIECCGLKSRFTQWVNFNTDCDMEDIMAVNFTTRALAGS